MMDFAKEVLPVNIEDEMKSSYMEYAMSVIVGRALPDVRDGLKPVHRRVLYAMHELGNDWNKPYKKSARIVGDVIGKYHPHGDTAVYDAIVRMAQPFSLRYMLVDGQGNFGSVDGDAPAAMRYTEVRMARITHELLADIDKETVDFSPNYDESEHEPAVFPARVPNLLINGATGIAVGLATNVPPHNLNEVIDACIAIIECPEIDIGSLMKYIPGPDFPTAAMINGARGIHEAYHSGRGRIYVRACSHVEEDNKGKQSIVVTELPYQVNKAHLLEKIAELVKDKRIEGITELRDESDKDGMRMVMELRRGEIPEVVLNNLYQYTQMQSVFGINMVALADGQPRLLNLKQILEAFVRHRREVVTRRTVYELRKARDRAHILEGLAIALSNIDTVIVLIKSASNPSEARVALMARTWELGMVNNLLAYAETASSRPEGLEAEYGLLEKGYRLSEIQAKAILELRLHVLTSLEQEKIVNEYKELLDKISTLLQILNNPTLLMQVICEELLLIKGQYGDPRRTKILTTHEDLRMEDLITKEDVVVTLSHAGYAKSQPLGEYRTQRRGGRGKTATAMKEEDFIDKLLIASTHDTILCFSNCGKVYWLKAYELPQAGRGSRGKPIVNLLPLGERERITAILPIHKYEADQYIFMATANGIVKKTSLADFSRPRTTGIIAIELREGDHLVDVALTDGKRDVLLFSSAGKSVRFHENNVRPMGRVARGVRGITLNEDQRVIALLIAEEGCSVLTATKNGYGKRSAVNEYPTHSRGGRGVISIQTTERNGQVVGAALVTDDDEVMLITTAGTLIRTAARDISLLGRNTQGVKLISLNEDETLAGIERIAEAELKESDDEGQDKEIMDRHEQTH